MAQVIEVGGKTLLVAKITEEFQITRCRSSTDCFTYSKKASDLDEAEFQLIVGNLIKQQNQHKTMEQLKNEVIISLKKAKKGKFYLSTKDIIKAVNEAFVPFEVDASLPCPTPTPENA